MQYLSATEYVAYGLGADTADQLVVAASAMIDAYCKRPSLGETQYVERVRFARGNRTAQMSNLPLVAAGGAASALVSVRTRMRRCCVDPFHPLAEEALLFATPAWVNVDVSTVEVTPDGVLCFTPSLLGVPFDEAEVTYTAGYTDVPPQVKVACAQIVRNAQATPALTVKQQSMSGMQMEYFSGTLMDADVQRLLTPYVSERVG
jgi:hypothetical protein